jgi:hypothetical protein
MKILLTYLCFVCMLYGYSQDYADTTREKIKPNAIGVAFSNQLNQINHTEYLISEHSLNISYKYDIIYVCLGVSFTNRTGVSTRYDKEYNLIGGTTTFGLDLYNYKNRIVVPFNMHFSYYQRQFIDRSGLTQHFSLKTLGINVGIEYRPFKPGMFLYGAVGPTYLTYRNVYKEPNGTPYDIRNREFVLSLECGIKYFFGKTGRK